MTPCEQSKARAVSRSCADFQAWPVQSLKGNLRKVRRERKPGRVYTCVTRLTSEARHASNLEMQSDRSQEPVEIMMPTRAGAQHERRHVVLVWLEVPQYKHAPVPLPAFSPSLLTFVTFPSLFFQLPDEDVLPPGGHAKQSVLVVHSGRPEDVKEAAGERQLSKLGLLAAVQLLDDSPKKAVLPVPDVPALL